MAQNPLFNNRHLLSYIDTAYMYCWSVVLKYQTIYTYDIRERFSLSFTYHSMKTFRDLVVFVEPYQALMMTTFRLQVPFIRKGLFSTKSNMLPGQAILK